MNFLPLLTVLLLPYLAVGNAIRERRATQQIKDLFTTWFKGDGTYYGKNGHLSGTCQLSQPTPTAGDNSIIKHYVAMNLPQWLNTLTCGMCIRVRAEGKGLGNDPITGDFYLYVKDLCVPCKHGDLDLSVDGDGRWDIEFQAVQCPVDATNSTIKYKFQGSNPWYLKVQTRNERVPITSMHLWKEAQGTWGKLDRTSDGFWVLGSGYWAKPLSAPFKVKLYSSVNGQTIEDTIPKLDNDVEIDGERTQFSMDQDLGTADHVTSVVAPSPAPTTTSTEADDDCEL